MKKKTILDIFTAPKNENQQPTKEKREFDFESKNALNEVRQAVFEGSSETIQKTIRNLLKQGFDAELILQEGMIDVMDVVGAKFSSGEMFIPEMLLAAKAMETGVEVLKSDLVKGSRNSKKTGKILLGTVFGDLHDIGKNLVGIMLRGVGFELIDLGINVSVSEFIKQIKKEQPDIIALSALLATTIPQMKQVIDTLSETGLRDTVKVIIGGAPVTQKYANQIGADGYAENAGDAATLAKQLITE